MSGRAGNPGEVPNAPLRDAAEAHADSFGDIARRMGWTIRGKGDSSRLKRTLGLYPAVSTSKAGVRYEKPVRAVRYETALLIVDALGADPVDFGL